MAKVHFICYNVPLIKMYGSNFMKFMPNANNKMPQLCIQAQVMMYHVSYQALLVMQQKKAYLKRTKGNISSTEIMKNGHCFTTSSK